MVAFGFTFTGCDKKFHTTNNMNIKAEAQSFVLDTTCTISVYGTEDQKLAERGLQLCKDYEKILSKTVEGSDIYKINNAGGTPVQVRPETVQLLKKAIYYSKKTDGLFDVSIGGVSELWDFSGENPKVPAKKSIEEALSHVGYKNIKIEGKTVRLADPKTKIDLGAIAKGYIADRVADMLREEGVDRAIINLGGNVLTIGEKQSGLPWNIGVEKPFSGGSQIVGAVKSKDSSVVTSGIYERQFKQDGVLYHHVLNPKTGYPVKTDLDAVSILSKESVEGDAISTCCLLLGKERAEKFISEIAGVEAIFIDSGGKVSSTGGSGFTLAE